MMPFIVVCTKMEEAFNFSSLINAAVKIKLPQEVTEGKVTRGLPPLGKVFP